MICQKCQSNNVTVITVSNGFGSWICKNCNATGAYPPATGAKTNRTVPVWTILVMFAIALPAQAQDSISDRLAAVERQNAVTAASLNGLSERLDRLEAKLDRLLAVQVRSPQAVQPQAFAPTDTQDDGTVTVVGGRRILFPRLHKLIFPRRGAGGCASGS